ncbi:dihydrouridine synthase dus family protein [Entamoeba histolytica]|uniref:Dihydrouridine synthase dus family protein n=4 Tax=Entamoeba histolytica TaxID=5759 RepID=A0A175JFJ9_ENTHI|nr:tRNA-dihydrouridine synthase, putative [Entamoeba histolytica KU27]ENY60644.1 tRNA-dihydrouridine synthase, putative [Entamoeba histolytica HM-1:IMSS-A]GAT92335.1 dihydrouridine synthase dus family protein [Entamoeba histolytica]
MEKQNQKVENVMKQERWWMGNNGEQVRVLAPMVGICTISYRSMALDAGASAVFTEELVSKRLCECKRVENSGIIQYIHKNDVMLTLKPEQQSKTILQLGTFDVESSVKCVSLIQEVCGIDINLGCGMWFSTKGEMGQALVDNRDKLEKIVKALVGLSKPISAKIRLQQTHEETLEFIQWLYSLGISIISLHGRHHKELYGVDCDWAELEKVVKDCPYDLILNGDICKQEDITKLLSFGKNVRGVMIGRGSGIHLGLFNPQGGDYVFDESKTKMRMTDFIQRAIKDGLRFTKIKFVLLQIIRYEKDYPFGSWRREKTTLKLNQINQRISSSKTIEQLIDAISLPELKKEFIQSQNTNKSIEEEKKLK